MNRGFLPFIVGGLLLGSGLDLAGTCPGMVYVEVSGIVVIVAKTIQKTDFFSFCSSSDLFYFPVPFSFFIHFHLSNH